MFYGWLKRIIWFMEDHFPIVFILTVLIITIIIFSPLYLAISENLKEQQIKWEQEQQVRQSFLSENPEMYESVLKCAKENSRTRYKSYTVELLR